MPDGQMVPVTYYWLSDGVPRPVGDGGIPLEARSAIAGPLSDGRWVALDLTNTRPCNYH